MWKLPAPLDERLDVLDHPRLVVSQDHRDEPNVIPGKFVELAGNDPPIRIELQKRAIPAVDCQTPAGLHRRWVLAGGEQNCAWRVRRESQDRQVYCLGAAAGEDHLIGLCAEVAGDSLPSILENSASSPSLGVAAAGIRKALAEMSRHRLDDFGQRPGRGIAVEEDALHGSELAVRRIKDFSRRRHVEEIPRGGLTTVTPFSSTRRRRLRRPPSWPFRRGPASAVCHPPGVLRRLNESSSPRPRVGGAPAS